MAPLQQLEEPIERRIASALIEATPEGWQKARLQVEAREEPGLPRHICPTVALYSEAVAVRAGRAGERWRVTARERRITI